MYSFLLTLGGLFLGIGVGCAAANTELPDKRFKPGAAIWPDTDGNHIIAHGGGILEHDGVYYWYGEQRRDERFGNAVRVYSSTDLYTWTNHGAVINHVDVFPDSILERPKVIYNEATDKFVMWWHQELPGLKYEAARTAVATADSPLGPFTFIRSFRPNVGRLPINAPIKSIRDRDEWVELVEAAGEWPYNAAAGSAFLRDLPIGQMARDLTLYKDDDDTAYLIFSSEENQTLHVAELDEDYTNFTGRFSRALPGGQNEAPAIWKHDGKYYMIASGLTGWAPNAARSHVAGSLLGEWTPLGNPMRGGPNPHNGLGPDLTFGAQSTFVLPIGEDRFLAMFDVWTPEEGLNKSRYVWLPIEMDGGRPIIDWRDEWSLEE